MKVFRRLLSNESVQKRYVKAGAIFGDLVSYIYMGESEGFENYLGDWETWEVEYAKRGLRTISLDAFIGLGGYNRPIDNLVGIRREENEQPIFHAKIYRETFLGKIRPAINLEKLMSEAKPQFSIYSLPSTERKE